MTLSWDHPKVFSINVMPAEADIDGLDHTNNAVYVHWCERAAWQHSEFLGIGLDSYRQQDRAMAIVKAEYEYLAATYQGEALELSSRLVNSDGKMRLQRDFQIIRPSDNALILRASWQFMCIEISSGKPKRMPRLFSEIYGGAVIDDEG
ncbi:MAG: thioesterase family protein [Halopseudomonas sp.]